MTAANPLLAQTDLPAYGDIRPEHVVPAVEQAIADHKQAMADLAAKAGDPGLLAAKAEADIALGRVWGVVEHLLMVVNTPELRAAHAEGQPLIDAHYTAVGQDRALYDALAAIDPDALDSGEQRALKLALQAFELSGVALEGQAREDFAANRVEQGRLETEFSNAVLDATQAWHLEIHDEARLAGLSEADRAGMEAAARAAGQEAGWRVTLHAPSVMAVLSHAEDRALRQEVYTAWNTRASDQGPTAGSSTTARASPKSLSGAGVRRWRWALPIRWRCRSRPRWRAMPMRWSSSSPVWRARRALARKPSWTIWALSRAII
jgi:oligopeptidase A